MKHDEEPNKWSALFRAPSVPYSDAMEDRIMARIHQLPVPGTRLSWRLFVRWMVPAFTIAMGCLVVALRVPLVETEQSTDLVEMSASNELLSNDDVVGLLLED